MREFFALISVRLAVGVTVILLVATWLGYVVQDSAIDHRIREELTVRADRLASAYATDVTAELGFIDSVVHFVASIDAADGARGAARLIKANHLDRSLSGNIGILDRTGAGIYIGAGGQGPLDLGDRPAFWAALASRTDALTVGTPVVSKISNKLRIPFAIPVRARDGRALGVVMTGVDPRTFVAAYDESDIGRNGSLVMIDLPTKITLSRFTITTQTAGQVVDPFVLKYFAAGPRGTFWRKSQYDGVLRAFAFRKLTKVPIVVLAGLAYTDAAARSADIRRNDLVAACGISFIILVVSVAWLRQIATARALVAATRRAEEASAEARVANQAKSDFLANMSHEIRTPLNGVIGLTYLALKTDLNERQRGYLQKINASATRLLAILNDVLDISKIEAGKIELEDANFSLDAVLEGISDVASVQAAGKGLSFTVERDEGVPTDLRGDSLRLGQVLTNIVGNAIKFTDRGSVSLRISREAGGPKELLCFTIEDTGIGMNDAQQARLFKSFSQADVSTTRRFGGTGLGLAISKRFVDMMGGRVVVKSAPAEGTTFTVAIPLKRAISSSHASQRRTLLAGLRVLVVDDEPVDRETIVEILRGWSMKVAHVSSAREASIYVKAAAARNKPVDVVVMDWRMPEADGIEAARKIKSLELTPAPAIIMVTAYGREHVLRSADAAGIDAVLVKPLDPSLLLETLVTSIAPGVPNESVPAAATQKDLTGTCILVAEDNPINQEIVTTLLGDAGATVECVSNGLLAVERVCAEDRRYDLVLMDLQMPEMDGLAATRRIREQFDSTALPIVAMTAHALDAERQRCLDAGMNDHVVKPIDPPTLLATVRRWTGRDSGHPAPSAEAELPTALATALPAFDVHAALRRCLGDEALLRDLLLQFASQFSSAASTLRDRVAVGDDEHAAALAHTLAGVAGQIGATDVYEDARNLKVALTERDASRVPELLDRLCSALEDALGALRDLPSQSLSSQSRSS